MINFYWYSRKTKCIPQEHRWFFIILPYLVTRFVITTKITNSLIYIHLSRDERETVFVCMPIVLEIDENVEGHNEIKENKDLKDLLHLFLSRKTRKNPIKDIQVKSLRLSLAH